MKVENKQQIIRELSDLRYIQGYSRKSLVEYLMDYHNLSQSRAYDLIREMMEEVADRYDKTNPNALTDAIEFMETMKAKAVGRGDTVEAMNWQKELNKVKQLHVQKVELEAKNIEGININIKRDKDEE